MLYKVVKEEGVTVDELDFAKGELLDLDSDAFNIPELVAEGAIVETEESDEVEGDDGPEDADVIPPKEGTHQPE